MVLAGRAPIEGHHIAGRHNLVATLPVPANDHFILNDWYQDWPIETLRNPDGEPRRRAEGRVRGELALLGLTTYRLVQGDRRRLDGLAACLEGQAVAPWQFDFLTWLRGQTGMPWWEGLLARRRRHPAEEWCLSVVAALAEALPAAEAWPVLLTADEAPCVVVPDHPDLPAVMDALWEALHDGAGALDCAQAPERCLLAGLRAGGRLAVALHPLTLAAVLAPALGAEAAIAPQMVTARYLHRTRPPQGPLTWQCAEKPAVVQLAASGTRLLRGLIDALAEGAM